ncbi:MAG: gamma carbonic anhydrase family protein [Chromatiales bacterium]|jgi:carbonic anhydrase/acetyltransferase-like protein (isoleucine patch superfamily)
MSNIRAFEDLRPRIAVDCWIDPSAVVIGDVSVGAGSSLWPGVVVRGDINRIRIGERTNIQDASVLHVTHDSRFAPGGHATVLGDDITVGHRVILHGCEIGHHCLIGMGATIMDGAVLEPYVMVGAGSLVTGGKTLESGYLYLGTPVRRVRELSTHEREYFEYSAVNYARLGARYRRAGG